MLEAFKTAFAAGWGIIAAVLSFALIAGLVDCAVKTVRRRQKIKMRFED